MRGANKDELVRESGIALVKIENQGRCDMAVTSIHRKSDLEPLIEKLSESRIVMLGEASHGTSEFYRARAAITRRLIERIAERSIAALGGRTAGA